MVLLITYAISKEIQNILEGSENLLFGAGKIYHFRQKEKMVYPEKRLRIV